MPGHEVQGLRPRPILGVNPGSDYLYASASPSPGLRLRYRLFGAFNRFEAKVGIDDEVEPPDPVEVKFEVWGNGELFWSSGVVQSGQAARPGSVDVAGREGTTRPFAACRTGLGAAHHVLRAFWWAVPTLPLASATFIGRLSTTHPTGRATAPPHKP